MGTDAYKAVPASATGTGRATLVKKANAAAGDPYAQAKPSRSNTMVERNGARYGVRVGINAPISHEAGATQANGRIIPSATKRTNDSFNAGVDTSY